MSRGSLLAVGTSDFIKKKFGEGYNVKITSENLSKYKQDILVLMNNIFTDY